MVRMVVTSFPQLVLTTPSSTGLPERRRAAKTRKANSASRVSSSPPTVRSVPMRCEGLRPPPGHRRPLQPDEKRLGLARGLAAIPVSAASRCPNSFGCLPPAATAGHLLQRADARSAAVDAMAKKGTGDCRAGPLRLTVVLQPCPGARLVDPDMPEIRAQLTPWNTRQYRLFG